MKNFEDNLPEVKKASIEIWQYFNSNELETLLTCFDNDDDDDNKQNEYELFTQYICHKFNYNSKQKSNLIMIDLFYYLIKFALKQNFSKLQINVLIYAILKTHELALSTAYGNIDECFTYLKDMMILYSVNRPPFSLKLFEPNQIKICLEYFFNTYFRHFKLYKLVFTPTIKLDVKFKYSNNNIINDEEESKEVNINEQNVDDKQENEEESKEEIFEINNEKDIKQNELDNELKLFIRNYLNGKVTQVKNELDEELKQAENELQRKMSINQSTNTKSQKPIKTPNNKK